MGTSGAHNGTMKSEAHVFITGGSGFDGGHLIRRLVRDGNEVVALARSASTAERVRALGASPARGSLDDVATMTAAMAGRRCRLPLRRRRGQLA